MCQTVSTSLKTLTFLGQVEFFTRQSLTLFPVYSYPTRLVVLHTPFVVHLCCDSLYIKNVPQTTMLLEFAIYQGFYPALCPPPCRFCFPFSSFESMYLVAMFAIIKIFFVLNVCRRHFLRYGEMRMRTSENNRNVVMFNQSLNEVKLRSTCFQHLPTLLKERPCQTAYKC